MNSTTKTISISLFTVTLGACLVAKVDAHMMVAQHGTLNVLNDAAFMLLSVPVSAFEGIDDDGDGQLSMQEFTQHRIAMAQVVKQNVTLRDMQGDRPLEGVMLSPVPEHETAGGLALQVVVMGRFSLENSDGPLLFQVSLFGANSKEQLLEITTTRPFDSQEHDFELTPLMSSGVLFPR